MSTYAAEEEDKCMDSQLKTLPEEPELEFSASASLLDTEKKLINKFQNIHLNLDSMDQKAQDDTDPAGGGPHFFPLRPYAEDCPHYIRTATCKFGKNCRYNHPLKRPHQAVKEKYWSSGNVHQTECKYYLTAGGCKNGMFCKYSHSKYETAIAPELNVLGFPIRLGEKECHYYMRYGSCGYGAQCVYHHPEPTVMEGLNTLGLSFGDEYGMKSGYSFGSSNSESPVLLLGASQADRGPCFSHPSSCKTLVYQNENSSYVDNNSLPQQANEHFEWSGYQAPNVIPGENTMAHLTPERNRADIISEQNMLPTKVEKFPEREQNLLYTKVEEFPERPGQPMCAYLLKTGDCKFKSACCFHHPKNWVPKSDGCVLSETGLPLRPGKEICRHYGRFGICKFGRACLFDHPIDLKFAPATNRSRAETATSNDSRSMTH